jgi:hypothetical protein
VLCVLSLLVIPQPGKNLLDITLVRTMIRSLGNRSDFMSILLSFSWGLTFPVQAIPEFTPYLTRTSMRSQLSKIRKAPKSAGGAAFLPCMGATAAGVFTVCTLTAIFS